MRMPWLELLKDGDRVITGPFDSVRGMYPGDAVTTEAKKSGFNFPTGR